MQLDERQDRVGVASSILMGILAVIYAGCFWFDLNGHWFDPEWTTDDAVQQTYIFHEVFTPGIWDGDLITTVMRGYLAPAHYWLTYLFTWGSGSAIQGGHLVMAVQLFCTLLFIFLAVRSFTGSAAPAFFASAWFLHTRTVVQRLTGGLPRGWAAPIFAAFIYCIATRRHKLLLLVFFIGCLTHPPATFLACVAYGVWLLWLVSRPATRTEGIRSLIQLALVAPILLMVTLAVVRRPPEVGQMVDSETAYRMPAFGRKGRFAFLPVPSISRHIKTYGYNAFVMRLYDPGETVKLVAPYFVGALLLGLVGLALKQRRELIPIPLLGFFIAIVSVYLLSRQVVFKLYVPDRHLLIPMTFFLIIGCTVAFWRLFHRKGTGIRILQPLMLFVLAGIIYTGSGSGFVGDCNFNYALDRKGGAFAWLESHSAPESIIAGHPTHIDPVMLFSKRRAYVTSEVAHPFYPKYYAEMEKRLEVSLKAHYALTINDFLALLDGKNIDYFVFSRMRFYRHNLLKETYFRPLDTLVEELTSRPYTNYAYKLFPKKVTPDFPPMVFRDNESVVIDLAALRNYVSTHPEFGERIP